jgi:integrase
MVNGSERRRANGEGTFWQEPDGRWRGQIDLGRGPDGRRLRPKVTGRSRTEAARKLRAVIRANSEGQDVSHRSPTVAAVATEWLSKEAARALEPSTLSFVRPRVLGHLMPGIGHHRVDQLRPEHVEAWLAAEAETGKAESTLKKYRQDARQILTWAMRRRLVTWNVAAVAVLPAATKPPAERRSLTEAEAGRLLEALAADRHGPYFTVMLMRGLRPGEVDGLEWDDVDLEAGVMMIHQTMKRANGGRALGLGTPKGKRPRTLALPAPVVEAFRRQRVNQAAERLAAGPGYGCGRPEWERLVFRSEIGTPHGPTNIRRAFARACARAGIDEKLVPYELRHSAGSLLLAAGVPEHEVIDLLGHRDGRMLARHYRHRSHRSWTPGRSTCERSPRARRRPLPRHGRDPLRGPFWGP